MTRNATVLLDLLEEAREADLGSRIMLRDPIAAHGIEAIRHVRPWLGEGNLAPFAIRVIERCALMDAGAKASAIDALRAVRGAGFSEAARKDAEAALERLGAPARSRERPRRPTVPTERPTFDTLVRGRVYRRRDLAEAGLLGNQYSGISYPAAGTHACLFSGGSSSEEYGYRDMPSGPNGYRYFGEWGGSHDMSLTRGNQVVVDRSPNLYLFVSQGEGFHRFEGRFMVVGHERVVAEREGTIGEAIVFKLERVADDVQI